ncbi:MAG: peptidoglycan editing factor PgeF [Marmoricola sp.]
MYLHRFALGPVDLAFTDRFGGVSAVPYDELNLAHEGGDDPVSVAENHRLLLADFAPDDALAGLHQVHGDTVVLAGAGGFATAPDADGVVSVEHGVTLMVRAADCVPVLLADPAAGVVGAAHSGRPGLVAGVVPATIARMRALGAEQVTAWIGPHVCGACYEVPEAMQAEVGAVVPESIATTSWGTPSLDIGAGVRAQLERAGVEVHDLSRCTRESADLYSYRRDGVSAGRLAGLIRLGG